MIAIEVAYATIEKQKILSLQVEEGTTALEAAKQSGIVEIFPEIEMESATMGIFSQTLGQRGLPPAEQYRVQSGDRIEIYRDLLIDPKEMRRQRLEKQKQQVEKAS